MRTARYRSDDVEIDFEEDSDDFSVISVSILGAQVEFKSLPEVLQTAILELSEKLEFVAEYKQREDWE